MLRLCSLFVAAVLLLAPASSAGSSEHSISWLTEKTLVNAIYARGHKKIMEANISPNCRQTALTALAAAGAADAEMKCETTTEKAVAIGDIILAVWDSAGYLMDDVNTVINGVPLCMSEYSFTFNPMKLTCLFSKFWPIYYAVKDFWNYQDFWMSPYKVVKEFAGCIHNLHSVSTANVQTIVNNARFCN